MSAIEITEETFEATVTKPGIVLLDFWAEWCGPCRRFAPVFEAASAKHPDITWGKIDTEAQQGLAGALRITSIPTLMVFRDGVLVFRQPGALPENVLEQLVEQVRKLDMDEVRKEIAAAKAEDEAEAGGATDEPSP
jgi:thioredoxin 1